MRLIARIFAGPVMALAGVNHFVMPDLYAGIIPSFLPAPHALVYASGAAELGGALMTLHPSTRRVGGWVLVTTLIAIFPANIFMAMNAEDYPDVPGGQVSLLARLPLQILFVYWAWLATMNDDSVTSDTES